MELERLKQIIESLDETSEPRIVFIKRAQTDERRVGVFASSFNPVTVAHVELMRRAAEQFSLDETIALAGKANADKIGYECSLEDRLSMLALVFADDERLSIGLSSHAYFVDYVDALRRIYPQATELYFILGFDTFARALDPENHYWRKYHRDFADRMEAINYLLSQSSLIVAGRAGAGLDDFRALVKRDIARQTCRVSYLDFPSDLGERSATEARERVRAGSSIAGLVPAVVERYIKERRLYE